MADTKIKDLTLKATVVATDEAVINDAAGGNLDKKITASGIKTYVKAGLVASDVTDFDTEVSNNTSVAANTAKTSNATHTGDVTGSTALTIAAKAVDVAMLADGTDGELITWSATGVAETVAVGTANHVLTSNGVGAAPTFQAAAGGGHTIEDEGTPLTARTKLNFVGTGVTVTDDAGDDATDVTISAGGDALTANPLSQFASTTSLELKNTISDETGSGALVFATSPTLVTPALGTPASGVATNLTGTAAGLTAGNVTTNANLTGDVTSVGNAATIAADVIVNADINSAAAIALSKLATDPLARANHTGTQAFSTVTGTVPINQGGSGQTTAQAAIDALSAVSAATNEHVLTKDTGTGNAIWKVAASGFSDPMTTRGDIIYKNAGGTTTRLPAGGAGEVLTSDGTDISWDTAGSGDMVLASVQTVTGAKTFLDDKLLIQNPATTFEYTIQGGAITADRSLSLPVITASDTLTTLGLSQTFTDNNNFNNADVGGQSVTTFTNAEASVNSPLVQLRQARGSIGSETADLASDELGTIEFHGYGTSYESGAYIKAIANQNWAGPDHGTKMVLATTSDDQNTPAARLEISNAGHFDFKSGYVDMLEQSTPGNPTSNVGRLYVADNASTTTLYFRDSAGTETNLLHGARRGVQSILFDFTTDVATGDGKFYFHIDPSLAGTDLIDVHAEVITAGTTGTTDIQIHNVTQAADMLSTKLTIDSAETGSDTAAAAAVIDTANDDVAENDVIRIDVDAVSTTAAKGLIVTMGFRLP